MGSDTRTGSSRGFGKIHVVDTSLNHTFLASESDREFQDAADAAPPYDPAILTEFKTFTAVALTSALVTPDGCGGTVVFLAAADAAAEYPPV